MASTTGPATVVPSIPPSVEESRAQRLQRQQARFRDRGGIFVPSNRNTLIDILLGRKAQSPKKRRSRSASCSPVKGKEREFLVGGQKSTGTTAISGKKTSPRKTSKRPTEVDVDEKAVEPIAGSSKLEAPDLKPKPARKARKGKEKADEPIAPKRRGRPPKAKADPNAAASDAQPKPPAEELDLEQKKPKGRKRVATATAKPATKKGRPRKRGVSLEVDSDEGESDEATINPPPITKLSSSATKPKATSKKDPPPKRSLQFEAQAGAQTIERPARRARSRKDKGAYLELSGDDTIIVTKPPTSKIKGADPPQGRRPDKKGKPRQQLVSIEEEACEHSLEPEGPPIRRPPTKKQTRPTKSVVDEASEDHTVGSRKRARPEPESLPGTTDLALRNPRSKKLKVDDQSQKDAKKRDEDVNSPLPDKEESTSKKRPLETIPEDHKKPAPKRTKVKSAVEPPDATPLETKDIKAASDEKDGKGAKVVRFSSSKQKENVSRGKAAKAALKKVKLPAKTQSSAPIIVPRRPPKSVLERIKEPRPQIEDDTPDPIDFLS